MKNIFSKILIKPIFDKTIVKDAIIISIIVGKVLNLVNQGDVLFTFDFEMISPPKLILTYFVPYFVSTYSSVKTKLSFNFEEECEKNHDKS